MQWVLRLIQSKITKGFYGSITINVFDGGVTNVEIKESFKEPK